MARKGPKRPEKARFGPIWLIFRPEKARFGPFWPEKARFGPFFIICIIFILNLKKINIHNIYNI